MIDASDLNALPRRRLDALNAGIARYFTGAPCKAGHIEYRTASNGCCRECARLKQLRYVEARSQGKPPRPRLSKVEKLRARRAHWRQLVADDPVGRWAVHAAAAAKQRAKKKGLPYNLTVADVRRICVDRCPALGLELIYCNPGRQVAGSANLDRIEPALGYVQGNVRVISKRANTVRNDASLAEIRRIFLWLASQEAGGGHH